MKRILTLILFTALLSACTLSQRQDTSGQSGEATLATIAPPASNTNANSALVANCDPRTTGVAWVLYTARDGDTVESVTHDQGTSQEIMMTGNCWTEFPTVKAGDQWYVPPASIGPPNLDNVPVGGRISGTPSGEGEGGTLSFLDRHVTITMTDYPANAASVFFYVRVNGELIGIGTDANLSDGASIEWDSIPNLTYFDSQLAAVAYDATPKPILKTLEFGVNTMP